jgi:hypothetical protein
MRTATTLRPDSDLRATLAKDIAEAVASGKPEAPVRTPAEGAISGTHYRPLVDLVSESIGAPGDPILTALLALVAEALRSQDGAIRHQAEAAVQAIVSAHIEGQIDAAVEEEIEAVGLFTPVAWSREGRRAGL